MQTKNVLTVLPNDLVCGTEGLFLTVDILFTSNFVVLITVSELRAISPAKDRLVVLLSNTTQVRSQPRGCVLAQLLYGWHRHVQKQRENPIHLEAYPSHVMHKIEACQKNEEDKPRGKRDQGGQTHLGAVALDVKKQQLRRLVETWVDVDNRVAKDQIRCG
jgi:hypothetical protein